MSATTTTIETVRDRLLRAAARGLAQYGPRKINLTDIAALAGVSRPTLYRHFPTKGELLDALAVRETERFDRELARAVHGRAGEARLDAALHFVAAYQRDYPLRGLVQVEPAFVLEQLELSLRSVRVTLTPLFQDVYGRAGYRGSSPADLADLVVRIALSHFLMRGDSDRQVLRELRYVAGITR